MGIAATKSLAKLGAERSKKAPELDGVLDLFSLPAAGQAPYLLQTPINDVWGVGWRLTPRLKAEGIYNALDLSQMRPQHAQQLMGVHGRQMVAELSGTACYGLESFGKVRQTIMHGRLFGEDTANFQVIEAAIASLTARAAFRLRREGLLAAGALVSLSTNRHKPGYQRQRLATRFQTPTADTGLITVRLIDMVGQKFRSSVQYHRADVLLYNLVNADSFQADLFGNVDLAADHRSRSRLGAVDALNQRYGKRTVHYAAEDLSAAWEPKHRLRSPRYTTNWDELPAAKIVK
jgi:DNA polymerase V